MKTDPDFNLLFEICIFLKDPSEQPVRQHVY